MKASNGIEKIIYSFGGLNWGAVVARIERSKTLEVVKIGSCAGRRVLVKDTEANCHFVVLDGAHNIYTYYYIEENEIEIELSNITSKKELAL